MKHNLGIVWSVCAIFALMTSCGKESTEQGPVADTAFMVSMTELVFDSTASSQNFEIKSKGTWAITSSQSWCTVSKEDGALDAKIEVSVSRMTALTPRQATITVSSGSAKRVINVTQKIPEPGVLTFLNKDIRDGKMMIFRPAAKGLELALECNVDYELKMVGGEWLTITSADTVATDRKNIKKVTYKFDVQENTAVEQGRTAVLNFVFKNVAQGNTARLEIFQQGSHDRETLQQIQKILGVPDSEEAWSGIVSEDNNYVHAISPGKNFISHPKQDELFALIAKFSHLKRLTIEAADVIEIPSAIFDIKSLEVLELPYNKISQINQADFDKLTSLTWLNMAHNQLTAMPDFMFANPKLTSMQLQDNQIKGQIPANFPAASALETLNLSNNEILGPIPTQIGNLEKMLWLNISHNKLTGPIPEEIGNMKGLKEFFAMDNLLSGGIPASVDNLSNLQKFYVIDNDLSGTLSDYIYGEMMNPSMQDVWNICQQRGVGFSNCKAK